MQEALIPWDRIGPGAWRMLELAAVESQQAGLFWLGTEMLLLVLAREEGSALSTLLEQIGIDCDRLSEAMVACAGISPLPPRSAAPAVDLLALQAADDVLLQQQVSLTELGNILLLTPRMRTLLASAASLAGAAPIDYDHMLVALLAQEGSWATQTLFELADACAWSSETVMDWACSLTEIKLPEQREQMALESIGLEEPSDVLTTESELVDEPAVEEVHGNEQVALVATKLGRYGRDLTKLALEGRLYDVVGEAAYRTMLQVGRILLQREANNPMLLGDPGVGKTAIVEGLAWYLVMHGASLHPRLANRRIVEISPGTLVAGTRYRGDLESRVRKMITEVHSARGRLVVFIDEIHLLLGGRSEGSPESLGDQLKPALARGEFPCIGATTVDEYRLYIERDPALARRFTPIWVDEPTLAEAQQIAQRVATERLAPFHNITFSDSSIAEAVRLSSRYIQDERLPSKALKVLDQAGVRAALGDGLVRRPPGEEQESSVQVQDVADVIALRTNIPIDQIRQTALQRIKGLEHRLQQRIKGQDTAIREVVRIVRRAGLGLQDPRRPQGVFLFAGPTGVGKTELSIGLAETLFDNDRSLLRLDMSEFSERFQATRLIGAAPGYIRSNEEGQLTGWLRRHPYSVVLFDEIEKADPEVCHLLLQLFDSGRLSDNRGRVADGRNAIFIMTTNLGAREALAAEDPQTYTNAISEAIMDHFAPEFVNRIDSIICFNPLGEDELMAIFDRELGFYQQRLRELGFTITVQEQAKRQLASFAAAKRMGARPLRRMIESAIITPFAEQLIDGELSSDPESGLTNLIIPHFQPEEEEPPTDEQPTASA